MCVVALALGVGLVASAGASAASNPEPQRLAAASAGGGLVADIAVPSIATGVLGGPAVVPDSVLARAKRVSGSAARVSGADRYATSVAVSRSTFASTASEVVLASGEDFPDALSAAPLAARLTAPLLLTSKTRLPASVATELRRLRPARITVVGGAGVVSDAASEAARSAAGGSRVTVRRFAGTDRYLTAARVAANFPAGRPGVVLASGTSFPDGVASGPVAAALRGPVLLTAPTALPAAVRAELSRLAPGRLVIAGGVGAVGAATESAAEAATRRSAERAAGADRYATSSALATMVAAIRPARGAFVATGASFPDALVGGVAAASRGGPVLLTGAKRGGLGTLAADLGRARRVLPWLQMSLDFVARQQTQRPTAYVAYDAAYQAASLGTLYGWREPEVAAQLSRLRSVRKPDGGYGMERAWDAFGDGSVNPPSTTYLISVTDHAGVGLMGGLRAGTVTAAEVGALVDLVMRWPRVLDDNACLAYSNAAADRLHCVYNVNSSAAWFLQAAWDAGVQRPGQRELAKSLYQHDVAYAYDGWWPYSSNKLSVRQDWNHNAAMVDFQFQLDVAAGQRSLDLLMPGGWVHPTPSLRTRADVMGYLRLLPYACSYRADVPAAARTLAALQTEASESGQLALWTVRTTASCGPS